MIAYPARPLRGWPVATALALLAACTATVTEEIRSDPAAAFQTQSAFIEAWDTEDYAAMSDLLTADQQQEWTPDRFERVIEKITAQGGIEAIDLVADDVVREVDPAEGTATFDYEVVYTSYALEAPVEFHGQLSLAFDETEARWVVEWDRSLLFSRNEGAHGFKLITRFPRRAPLVDRHGRKLAVGRAAERRYPYGSAGGTTIGHLEPVTKRDVKQGSSHAAGDLVGGSGLEEAFEERLAGTPTTRLLVVDRSGEVIGMVARQEGSEARPLRTTLDIRVQQAAEAAYGATTGGAVVLDPRTGDILAAVASSPFNPANYVGVSGIEPFNRALSGLYPPGSSMKVMTASTALELGEVTPTTELTGPAEYKGVRNFESGAYGTLSFASALQNSVNTAFAQVAEKIGPKRLTRFAELFGFNRAPSMALEAAKPSFPFPEDEGDLLWSAIGQAQTLATPLQMATMAATIANHGKRMEPRIVASDDPEGERVVSQKTARIMTTLMESVVQGGTGVAAQISGVRVAGKTGTAEVDVGGERKNHAWFICFAPAGNPKIAVAVVSEYGGIGGQVAAPLARAILTAVLPLVR